MATKLKQKIQPMPSRHHSLNNFKCSHQLKTKTMKKTILLLAAVAISFFAPAQTKYFTKNGRIFFNASSPLEKIEAINDKATSVIDLSTGQIEFGVLLKAFLFERALMQEHFNENYVESDKFPKAVFK